MDGIGTSTTLLHLLPLREHRQAGAEIRPASLNHDGFVHCSPDERTTLAVANMLYAEHTEPLVALELDPARIDAEVRWEEPTPAPPPGITGDVLFPHVYGPLPREAVVAVRHARSDSAGYFTALETPGATAHELGLLPHPEGGWYRRTWTNGTVCVPDGYAGQRPTATAVYFLLHPGERSTWHTVLSDELWLWHRGSPLHLWPGGSGDRPVDSDPVVLGPRLEAGQRPQFLVPGGNWQRAEAAEDGEVLVSCVVSPGFDVRDLHIK